MGHGERRRLRARSLSRPQLAARDRLGPQRPALRRRHVSEVHPQLVSALAAQFSKRRRVLDGAAAHVGWKLGVGDAERIGDEIALGHLTSATLLATGSTFHSRALVRSGASARRNAGPNEARRPRDHRGRRPGSGEPGRHRRRRLRAVGPRQPRRPRVGRVGPACVSTRARSRHRGRGGTPRASRRAVSRRLLRRRAAPRPPVHLPPRRRVLARGGRWLPPRDVSHRLLRTPEHRTRPEAGRHLRWSEFRQCDGAAAPRAAVSLALGRCARAPRPRPLAARRAR
jgi:hypothetical protein